MSPRLIQALAVVAFLAALCGLSYRHGVTTTDTAWRERHAQDVAKLNAKIVEQSEQARAVERTHAATISEIDSKYTEAIRNANDEAKRTIDSLRAGTVRVRERFTCGSTAGSVPGVGTSTSVDHAAPTQGFGAEDAAVAIGIADRGDAIARQLEACQAIVRADRDLLQK